VCWVPESARCSTVARSVSPGQSAGRHLFDRERSDQGLLYRALGARNHAGLLHSGNFVGGPEVFKQGLHVWSGSAAVKQHRASICRACAAPDGADHPPTRHRDHRRLEASRANAIRRWRKMLGTRSPTERLSQLLLHLMNLYGVEERDGTLIRGVVHPRRPRAHDGRDAAVCHHQPQSGCRSSASCTRTAPTS